MQLLRTAAEVRAARTGLGELGLVPTMGFLHAGHLSLVERAKVECGAVAVSIFVNPAQFGAGEDLARYPRDLQRDLAMLREAGVDLVLAPAPEELYPPGFSSRVEVGALAERLEGAARPGHFAGVATIVAKLFNIFQPTRAYFGQKDAQQSVVIRRMTRDLDFPVRIVVAPTVREGDGLALSSRNSYLQADERGAAPILFQALSQAAKAFEAGERNGDALRERMRRVIGQEPLAMLDYVSVADAEILTELERVEGAAIASLAVRFGATRLIDNIVLTSRRRPGDRSTRDPEPT